MQFLKEDSYIKFERCGNIIISTEHNILALCCKYCTDLFSYMPQFMRHLHQKHNEQFTFTNDFNTYCFEELLAEDIFSENGILDTPEIVQNNPVSPIQSKEILAKLFIDKEENTTDVICEEASKNFLQRKITVRKNCRKTKKQFCLKADKNINLNNSIGDDDLQKAMDLILMSPMDNANVNNLNEVNFLNVKLNKSDEAEASTEAVKIQTASQQHDEINLGLIFQQNNKIEPFALVKSSTQESEVSLEVVTKLSDRNKTVKKVTEENKILNNKESVIKGKNEVPGVNVNKLIAESKTLRPMSRSQGNAINKRNLLVFKQTSESSAKAMPFAESNEQIKLKNGIKITNTENFVEQPNLFANTEVTSLPNHGIAPKYTKSYVTDNLQDTNGLNSNDLDLLKSVGLKIMANPICEHNIDFDALEMLHKNATKFANLFKQRTLIWKPTLLENNYQEVLHNEFIQLMKDTKSQLGTTLTLNELKRIVNIVTMWYSKQCDAKLIDKKKIPKSFEFYVQLFSFIPKTTCHHYYCEYCPQQFNTNFKYTAHRITHTEVKEKKWLLNEVKVKK